MDKTTLEKLNYNELKEIVKEYCVSGLGKALIDKLELIKDDIISFFNSNLFLIKLSVMNVLNCL